MSILITGAAGFIGQELAALLLKNGPETKLVLTDIVQPSCPDGVPENGQIQCIRADLSNQAECEKILGHPFSACFLLHGIMSGGAEQNFELGYRINLDSTRIILDHLRKNQPGVKVVFPSSLAVFGPSASGQIVSETTAPQPQSSYGTQKNMIEILLNDYSRRGMLDGRVVRLPTIIVRPGKPTAAASSFASGIVRESFNGEKNILPVSPSLKMWICSPETVVKYLVLAMSIPKEKFGLSRTVNLPGIIVTVGGILEAIEHVGGPERRALVEEKRDTSIEKIVGSWPAEFDISLAKSLGFVADKPLRDTIRTYADSLRK